MAEDDIRVSGQTKCDVCIDLLVQAVLVIAEQELIKVQRNEPETADASDRQASA